MKNKLLLSMMLITLVFCTVYIVKTSGHPGQPQEQDQPAAAEEAPLAPRPVSFLAMGGDVGDLRTDVMLLVFFDGVDRVDMVQIPRDTKVSQGKINSLYGLGKAPKSLAGVKEVTGLELDRYVYLNLKAFRDCIDAMGGVSFDVPEEMNYTDAAQNLSIHLEKGAQVLNGAQAEMFVRYRSSYAEGDIGRLKAQQAFLKSVVSQVKEIDPIKGAYLAVTKILPQLDTNFTAGDIAAMAPYLKNLDPSKIHVHLLPGTARYENGISYYFADREEAAGLIAGFAK